MNKYLKLLLLNLLILVSFTSFASSEGSITGEIASIINNTSNTSKVLQILVLVTIISAAPSILIMATSYVRIAIVFSFLRTALGLQQSPPNQVLTSLAIFLTFFIMSPVVEESYNNGIKPWIEETTTEEVAIPKMVEPFRKFMLANTRDKDLDLFAGIAKLDSDIKNNDIPIQVVTPAFMISELRRAFEIGFLIFLPFLIIDILVASLLMAMGMMMMPPVMIALPFKVIFFVVIDGWYLLAGSLVKSFIV